jgi:predicted transcriptional regulator
MSTERVTVSLPSEVREAAQRIAEETGTSFSGVVTDALLTIVRRRVIDELLAQYEAEHGAFTEDELRRAADDMGLPYIPRHHHDVA